MNNVTCQDMLLCVVEQHRSRVDILCLHGKIVASNPARVIRSALKSVSGVVGGGRVITGVRAVSWVVMSMKADHSDKNSTPGPRLSLIHI